MPAWLIKIWTGLKPVLFSWLKTEGVKWFMVQVLKMSPVGIKAWVVKFVLEHFVEDVAIPLINATEIEVLFYIDKQTGKKYVIQLKKARESEDPDEYDIAIDTIFRE